MKRLKLQAVKDVPKEDTDEASKEDLEDDNNDETKE